MVGFLMACVKRPTGISEGVGITGAKIAEWHCSEDFVRWWKAHFSRMLSLSLLPPWEALSDHVVGTFFHFCTNLQLVSWDSSMKRAYLE